MASPSPFFLPPHFLSLPENTTSPAAASFPTDFPYDFSPSPLPSPVDSPLGSADDDDDEEDFLAALTQRLTQSTLRDPHKLASLHKSQAKTAVAGSPQSTLSGFGSWSVWSSVSSDSSPNGPSQGPSPPTTPFAGDDNTWDLIQTAAKQVARLKLNTHRDGIKNTGFCSNASQFRTELPICKPERCFNWARQGKVENQQIHGRFVDFPQPTWPSLQPHHRRNPSQPCAPAVPTVFHGGRSAPKKECAGTGVFLPRRYNNPPQPRQTADCGSIALFSGKNDRNLNRSVPQTTSNHRLPPSFEAVERNAILGQQRLISYSRPAERNKSHEFLLPQEWTY